MNYYKLMYDYENSKGRIFGKILTLNELNRYDFEKGEILPIKENELKLELDVTDDNGNIETDYFSNDLILLIVSEKTKNVFEKIQKEGIQFIAIDVIKKDKIKLKNKYYLVNILNIEDVLDLNNSKYDKFDLDNGEKFISIERHALFENKIQNNIFRLKNDTHSIFVSQILKKMIEKEKLTGFDFLGLNKKIN